MTRLSIPQISTPLLPIPGAVMHRTQCFQSFTSIITLSVAMALIATIVQSDL